MAGSVSAKEPHPFTITAADGAANAQVAVLDLQTRQRTTLIRGASQAEYVETGHVIYAVAGTLRAVRFDLATLTVRGDPVPVVEQVQTLATGAANFGVSRQGTLVYVPGGAGTVTGASRSLVWVTRHGIEESIPAAVRAYLHPRLSPDGTRVAVAIQDQDQDIWMWDFARRALDRVTSGPDVELFPVWTPNGGRLLFTSARAGAPGLYWQPADGTGTAVRLASSPTLQVPQSISPDGMRLVLTEVNPKTRRELSLMTLSPSTPVGTEARQTVPLLQKPSNNVFNGEILAGRPLAGISVRRIEPGRDLRAAVPGGQRWTLADLDWRGHPAAMGAKRARVVLSPWYPASCRCGFRPPRPSAPGSDDDVRGAVFRSAAGTSRPQL